MLPTSLRSADSSKIGLSSPQTRDKTCVFDRSAILLCYRVVLGSLVENLLFSLVALVLFCLEKPPPHLKFSVIFGVTGLDEFMEGSV